jgi:hypothetical protein
VGAWLPGSTAGSNSVGSNSVTAYLLRADLLIAFDPTEQAQVNRYPVAASCQCLTTSDQHYNHEAKLIYQWGLWKDAGARPAAGRTGAGRNVPMKKGPFRNAVCLIYWVFFVCTRPLPSSPGSFETTVNPTFRSFPRIF